MAVITPMPIRNGMLWVCLGALTACRAPDSDVGPYAEGLMDPWPFAELAPRAEVPPGGSAYLTVTNIAVSPTTVRPNQAFEVKLRAKNDGIRTFGTFKMEIQANRESATGVVSYPLGSEERLELRPGETAEFVIHAPNGLPESGVYVIAAGIQVVDLARAESTDYVNPNLPTARLVVE